MSEAMLEALKRWRKHLNVLPLPLQADAENVIPKNIGKGPVTSTELIRKVYKIVLIIL